MLFFFEIEIVCTHVKEKSILYLVMRWERKNRTKIIPGFAFSL